MTGSAIPVRAFCAFALLSTADFALTWHLLGRGEAACYEANPVANWWLLRFGWAGLAAFKAATVLVAGLLTIMVARRRPVAAQRLLIFGCAVVGAVVMYSGALASSSRLNGRTDSAELTSSGEKDQQLDNDLARNRHFREVLNHVGAEVLAGRMTLSEASDHLEKTSLAKNRHWNEALELSYPGALRRGQLAAFIVQHTLRVPLLFPTAPLELDRLKRELRYLCGVDVVLKMEDDEGSHDVADAEPLHRPKRRGA